MLSPLTMTHSGCSGVVVPSHRQQQHPGLAKLPGNEAKIASKLTKGVLPLSTGKLANVIVLQRSLKKTPELIYFGMGRRGCIPDHVERRNCLMQFHTVKPKISTTSETLKLESMRFQTSLNRAPAPARSNLDMHQLLGKK